MSYFSDFYAKIKYPIASTESLGLRNAQLGAIHAIAAHATLEPNDASVIVLHKKRQASACRFLLTNEKRGAFFSPASVIYVIFKILAL